MEHGRAPLENASVTATRERYNLPMNRSRIWLKRFRHGKHDRGKPVRG